jgi:putative transposase
MARPLRIEYEGAVYHVISRGNENQSIYRNDSDRLLFFKILDDVVKKFNWLVHAYCLMRNHYHLVIETVDATLSRGMRQLNGVYTQAFNNKHKRAGHLYQGRFKSILIQKDNHLLEVCRYIVLNPVKAGIVHIPEGYKWSSYNSMTGKQEPLPFFTKDWILSQFGTKHETARKGYMDFIKEGTDDEGKYGSKELKNMPAYGDDNFIQQFKDRIKGKKEIKEIVRKERYAGRPRIEDTITPDIMPDKKARNEKIITLIYNWGYGQKEIADRLKLHYSSISKMLAGRRVENYKKSRFKI